MPICLTSIHLSMLPSNAQAIIFETGLYELLKMYVNIGNITLPPMAAVNWEPRFSRIAQRIRSKKFGHRQE
ncbi:hypothetical protein CPB84DRAFT_1779284 [Gymnopilus junonius]|uniref:Uncharacterized protein n=1 Tax=Gymnopilus junonius TaxID=109634 RepID=A0A9P5NP66_GYMJU|nr:hypothetical protein CPB84DRAFT_1779284 [Gymnopilus junonius]